MLVNDVLVHARAAGVVSADHVATRLVLIGDDLPPDRAFDLGRVNELTDPGQALERAAELVDAICRAVPTSVGRS